MLVGPGVDLVVYVTAVALAMPPGRAQLLSFATAAALGYLPLLRAPRGSDLRTVGGIALHAAAVTLAAFWVRAGVWSLASKGLPTLGAFLAAAAATVPVMRVGFSICASQADWRTAGAAGWRRLAIGIAILAVALRLIYAAQVELMPEEAYYWNYARHLDIGYLDHPPMVAWLIAAGTRLAGGDELGVRLGALCSAALATWFVYRLTRACFDASSALAAVVLMQVLPFFFLAGMLMTPDSPLTSAWAASLYFLQRALIERRPRAWWGAGLALGLGLLSKYTIVLVGCSALLFVLADPASRRWLGRPQPYGAAALALAVFSPVIWWNAHHEWASFLFQTSRRLADRPQFALHKLIASALVLLTPAGFAAVGLLLGRRPAEPGTRPGQDTAAQTHAGAPCAAAAEAQRRIWLFLRIQTLTPLAVFAVFSLRHEVKLDWTGAPWLAAVPLLAWGMAHRNEGAPDIRGRLARAMTATSWVLPLIYGAGLYFLTSGIAGLGYGGHAELVPVGWRELGRQVHAIADRVERQDGAPPLVVGMDRYAIASELAFYSPDQAAGVARTSSGHLLGQAGLMYERWFAADAQRGRTLLLVAWDPGDLRTPQVLAAATRLGPIEEGRLTRDGEMIRRYYYRLVYGYGVKELDACNRITCR